MPQVNKQQRDAAIATIIEACDELLVWTTGPADESGNYPVWYEKKDTDMSMARARIEIAARLIEDVRQTFNYYDFAPTKD